MTMCVIRFQNDGLLKLINIEYFKNRRFYKIKQGTKCITFLKIDLMTSLFLLLLKILPNCC